MKKYCLIIAILFTANMFSQDSELDTYMKSPLKKVFLVTSDKDKLSITGYQGSSKKSTTKDVTLERGEVLAIWKGKILPSISILTVPFKVRRKVANRPQLAMSGLTNVGLNMSFPELKLDRYFSKGTKSSHSVSLGFYFSPSVEELTPLNTNVPIIEASSKQLFVTTAMTVLYTYNNIQLCFVPIGCDLATNSEGKNWVYNGRNWFGFGIGFDPKIFSPGLNK